MMTPSYMEWYRAAMANGGVVPAAGTPLQVVSQHEFAVPVVVPVNLMPGGEGMSCLLYTSPSPRDKRQSRMPSSA